MGSHVQFKSLVLREYPGAYCERHSNGFYVAWSAEDSQRMDKRFSSSLDCPTPVEAWKSLWYAHKAREAVRARAGMPLVAVPDLEAELHAGRVKISRAVLEDIINNDPDTARRLVAVAATALLRSLGYDF